MMEEKTDVIVVGTGVAGLFSALNLPRGMRVLLITKAEEESSDSFLAQGGICMLRGEDVYKRQIVDPAHNSSCFHIHDSSHGYLFRRR